MAVAEEELWEWAQDASSRETAYEFAYRVIRRALLDGYLSAGRRLIQTEIAERLGVSTTPIREALHKLASEGLVDFDAGRGALVHVLSQSEWNEIIDIRDQLEPFALRRAAERIDDQTLARMEQIHQAMADASDSALWVDLNRQFHHLYYRAAGLPRLEAILGALQDASATYVAKLVREYPDFRPIGHGEHAAIVEHLRNHDWNALEKVIRIHIRPSAFDYEY